MFYSSSWIVVADVNVSFEYYHSLLHEIYKMEITLQMALFYFIFIKIYNINLHCFIHFKIYICDDLYVLSFKVKI